ncbi:MAG TPA: hypothetical protein VF868_06790 [Bacteroidia bacterium]|jgi:hypothetical protein
MKINNITRLFMTAAVISVFSISCKKDKDDTDKETVTARDNALAEHMFSDVSNIADQAVTGSLSTYLAPNTPEFKSMLSGCAIITHDSTSVPRMLTISFGSSNCLCSDGRYRRGSINVSYTGGYRDSASTHTITFTNYYVNDHRISGSKTVINNGHNTSGNLTYAITVNGQIDKPSNGSVTWTSSRTREWILGDSTAAWGDDVYLISGSANGVSVPVTGGSTSFTMNITSSLRKEIGCRNIVSGKFELTPSGKATRYVDFGNGACDNQAQVTINNRVYMVNLN